MGCCSSKPKTLHARTNSSQVMQRLVTGVEIESVATTETPAANATMTTTATTTTGTLGSSSRESSSNFALPLSETRLFIGDGLDAPVLRKELPREKLSFTLSSIHNIKVSKKEKDKLHSGKDGFVVRVCVYDESGKLRYAPVHSKPIATLDGTMDINLNLSFEDTSDSDMIMFSLLSAYFNETSSKKHGKTMMSVGDFRSKPEWEGLWLFNRSSIALFDKQKENPTTLTVKHIKYCVAGSKDCENSAGTVESMVIKREENDEELEKQVEASFHGSEDAEQEDMNAEGFGADHVLSDDEEEDKEDLTENGGTSEQEEKKPVQEGDVEVEKKEVNGKYEKPADEESSNVSSEDKQTEIPKHVLIITRGTRGDVQPFIALARGLAELKGWHVTICTELRYRGLVNRYKDTVRGKIQFRPSGGDTETRIAQPIAKWAVSTKMRLMHAAMLARTEREFFDSEPAYFYWAKRLKPDILCYTFTTANITMIISEALKIPSVGFFLQPTVLPSKQYPAIVPLRMENLDDEANQLEVSGLESHKAFRFIKRWWENNIFSRRLEDMRVLRGLPRARCHENDFERITNAKLPLIIPIKPKAFGGKPTDWPESFSMTDFIFLRGGATPDLEPELETFIQNARKAGNQLVVICFSSMPVSRIKIEEAALLILDKCPAPYKPCIIALIGERPNDEPRSQSLEERCDGYTKQGRLFIGKGAPFSKLFPRMDFIVLHGGLGTTAEALAAGVPCMVTGVLLMDQRFWGARVFKLGVGPPPCHISDFNGKILDVLPQVLDPKGTFVAKAKSVANELFPEGLENLSDGVSVNVDAFVEAAERSFPAPPPN